MPEFMVERYLPGVTWELITAAAARAERVAEAMTSEGDPVHYLRCTFVPSEESVFCLFAGSSLGVVEEANRRANFPFERVYEVVDVLSTGSPAGRGTSRAGRGAPVSRRPDGPRAPPPHGSPLESRGD